VGSVKRHSNGRWRARYRDESGGEHARHFARKIDAERWLATVQADMLRGTYVDPRAGRVTFRDYAERWRSIQVHRPTTRAQIETHLRRNVYPYLGDRPMGSIRRSEIQAWIRRLVTTGEGRRALAPSTIEVVYRYVVAIFRSAVADRVIVASPCIDVRLPKGKPRRVEPISTEAVMGLVDAVEPRYRALIVLGAGTGLRHGEAVGVELDQVDFLRRTLDVRQQLVVVAGEEPKVAPPKTAGSYRTVPLPRVVLGALAAHVAEFPPTAVELEDVTGPEPVRRRVLLLFTTPDGRPLRRTSFSAGVWQKARALAGLPESVTFHDLRHYYASLLIRHNESVKVVQARLGHASAAETLDTYSHLWPDSEDRTRLAVDQVLGVEPGADSVRTGDAW
jgi:integrase